MYVHPFRPGLGQTASPHLVVNLIILTAQVGSMPKTDQDVGTGLVGAPA
jgi:hypothetical protein